MIRDIKFRAWDGKKLLGPSSILDFDDDDYGPTIGGQYFKYPEYPNGVLYFEQYTGLKDKNGVEIYEGDVVRSSYFENKKKYLSVKTFEHGQYDLTPNTPISLYGHLTNYSVEVIGNIHENPELIK